METRSYEIGLRVPPCTDLVSVARFAGRAEERGIDALWFPDSQLLWRDTFMTLGAVAMKTERIGLGTAVTNLETRHVSVIASTLRTVHEVAPGRVTFGVGVGNTATGPSGLPQTARRALAERITLLREMLAGNPIDMGRGAVRMQDPTAPCPIVIAARGPRNLELAGRIGDGVMLQGATDDSTMQHFVDRVEAGVRAAKRQMSDVSLVLAAYCYVTDDPARDARVVKPFLGLAARSPGFSGVLDQLGIELDPPALPPRVEPDLVHAFDWEAAIEACSWVSDEAAAAFAESCWLFGTASEILQRLTHLHERFGIERFILQHYDSWSLPDQLVESFTPPLRSPREN